MARVLFNYSKIKPKEDNILRYFPEPQYESIAFVNRIEDINFNCVNPNNLYLRSSEGRCYIKKRQEAMLIGEIRTLLEKPGGKNIRIIYFKNLNNRKLKEICEHLELMIKTMEENNTLNLSLQLETQTKTPLVVSLSAKDDQILQSMKQ